MDFSEWMNLELFTVGGTTLTPTSIGTLLLVVLASYWVSKAVRRVLRTALTKGGLQEEGTLSTIERLTHYAVLLVGFAVGLQTIGISVASLFAAGAFVAVAVGFALQNILQNFVSGVILLAERSITEQDVLEVDNEMILVERIGARSTVARNRDDHQRIIPNSSLVQSTVVNYTLTDSRYRVRAPVGVSYSSDMDEVEAALLRAALAVPDRDESREPIALLLDFGDSAVVWEVSIWATDPWPARVHRSHLNKAVWNEFKKAGITIAFPQLDVHVIPPADDGPTD